MILCSNPECQTTAGCQCNTRELLIRRQRLENRKFDAALIWRLANKLEDQDREILSPLDRAKQIVNFLAEEWAENDLNTGVHVNQNGIF